jgi:hypothetical protein
LRFSVLVSVSKCISAFLSIICWRACLFSTVCFFHLCQESGGCSCIGLFLGLLFYSISLFLFQYLAVFFIMALWYNLKSGIVVLSVCSGFLWLFGVLCASLWILCLCISGDCIESVDHFW